ncbi:MAG: hypothetical protein IJZ39_08245 [Oscillospiraceae bacterium]|nr:hypothetical protein [Oscillospiraceae bacterium]
MLDVIRITGFHSRLAWFCATIGIAWIWDEEELLISGMLRVVRLMQKGGFNQVCKEE